MENKGVQWPLDQWPPLLTEWINLFEEGLTLATLKTSRFLQEVIKDIWRTKGVEVTSIKNNEHLALQFIMDFCPTLKKERRFNLNVEEDCLVLTSIILYITCMKLRIETFVTKTGTMPQEDILKRFFAQMARIEDGKYTRKNVLRSINQCFEPDVTLPQRNWLRDLLQVETINQHEISKKKLEDELKSKSSELERHQEELQSKCLKVKNLEDEFQSKCWALKKLENEFLWKCVNNENLQVKLNAKCLDMEKLEDELRSKCLNDEKLQYELHSKCLDIENLKDDLQSKCLNIEKLQDELNSKHLEIQKLQDVLKSKCSDMENLNEELHAKCFENEKLQERLQSKCLDFEKLEDELQSKHMEATNLDDRKPTTLWCPFSWIFSARRQREQVFFLDKSVRLILI